MKEEDEKCLQFDGLRRYVWSIITTLPVGVVRADTFCSGDLGQDIALGYYMGTHLGERFDNIINKPWRLYSRQTMKYAVSTAWFPAFIVLSSPFIICSGRGTIWYKTYYLGEGQ